MTILRVGCQVIGFALVFAAFSGTASAVDIPGAVPELNPSSMASALTLLTAGVALLATRRRK